MKQNEYKYGVKKLSGLSKVESQKRIRRHLIRYAAALKKEATGKYVIVFMDESYIHQGYCAKRTWYCAATSSRVVPNRVKGSEKGKRLIVIHAMTKFGLLELPTVTDEDCENLEQEKPSAAVVTSKLSAEGFEPEDYHDTLDGPKFVAWMRNRLFPAFEKLFPKKKMILVLDNAKYHHARGDDFYSPAKMNRGQCADFLRQTNYKTITGEVRGTVKTYRSSQFSLDERDGGPTLGLLRKTVKEYLSSHPQINQTIPQQLMADKGYELLYTPPYESWLQPIELVWARMKQRVARQSDAARKWQETQAQTLEALRAFTPKDCSKIIGHVHKWMTEWLGGPEAGSLSRFKTLQALMAATKKELNQLADVAVEDGVEVPDVDAEKRDQESVAA